MPDCLLYDVKVIDPKSPFHLQHVDLLVRDGKVVQLGLPGSVTGQTAEVEIKATGYCISPGWVASQVHLQSPGFEYRETIDELVQHALWGGFTDIVALPNTDPCIDNAAILQSILGNFKQYPIALHCIGALTRGCAGKGLAEIADLAQHGAVAFSDGIYPTQDGSLLMRAFQYLEICNGFIIQLPHEVSLEQQGVVHESPFTSLLGLNGIPSIAEEMMISRCIQLVEHTGGRIHFSPITTERSVELVRKAQADGLRVSADTASQYLVFDQTHLASFDAHYKVLPPLRTAADATYLIAGLADGTLSGLSTHHAAMTVEEKEVEFDQAEFGMFNLPYAAAWAYEAMVNQHQMSISQWVAEYTELPRHLLGLEQETIDLDAPARFTLFDPAQRWNPRQFANGIYQNVSHLDGLLPCAPLAVIIGKQFIPTPHFSTVPQSI
jgi:dihydroorotase